MDQAWKKYLKKPQKIFQKKIANIISSDFMRNKEKIKILFKKINDNEIDISNWNANDF